MKKGKGLELKLLDIIWHIFKLFDIVHVFILCKCSDSHAGKAMAPHSSYSCLENPMDGGAWQAAVYGVAKSRTRLSDFTLTFHFHALEKEMATRSSVLAWRIPGMVEPDGLQSWGRTELDTTEATQQQQ